MLQCKGKTKWQEHKEKLGNLHEVVVRLGLKRGVILTGCDKRKDIKFRCRISQATGSGKGKVYWMNECPALEQLAPEMKKEGQEGSWWGLTFKLLRFWKEDYQMIRDNPGR